MAVVVWLVRILDLINEWVGRIVSWLTVTMVITVFVVVVLRYGFSLGWIWMQEIYVWMHGALFMLAAGYTLLHNGHVRIDLIYRTASARYKAVVDFFGSLLFILPLVWLTWEKSVPMAERSWMRLESSPEAEGMPGLFLLKTVIPIFCVLMGMAGVSMMLRSLLRFFGIEIEPDYADDKDSGGADTAMEGARE
ncbi:MAG: TRAP transporter small permease subunit [Hyphomicrobiales bacterium]|nr:TRAP transporter small permease subunit [Hyphomicrobiales bacterium]MCP5372785.1 TRAP transporter small permease subunit [Hyphomicrobiales bacterium]